MRDRPSFTAQRVAVQRARLDRPASADGDAQAERRLYEGLSNPLLFRWLDDTRMRKRTSWFDDATVDALGRGVQQIVIVGAGYDGRALRFKSDGVRWFEVDHPATQADKRRRVEALGVPIDHISFVAVDLLHDDLDAALDDAGHRADTSSLFICEGLLGYLPEATIVTVLSVLRRRSVPGTTLAANFRVVDEPRWLGDRVVRAALDGVLTVVGETRRTEFRDGDPERLLAEGGWRVERESVADRMRLDGGSRGVLMVAGVECDDRS